MLGGLKDKAKQRAFDSLQPKVEEEIQNKRELFESLTPADVNDDAKYQAIVVDPLWMAVKLQSGPAVDAAQKFVDVETKFRDGVFNLRDELIVVAGGKVSLDPDFTNKAGPTVFASFQ